jgi:preprotein translocase subunit SecG
MYHFISVLAIIVSIFLILIVLVQNSKGGGLASNFSSSNQVMGVRKTTDFLEKATWYLAGTLLVLSLWAVFSLRTESTTTTSGVEDALKSTTKQAPSFPIANPGQEAQPVAPAPSK